jgi:hypothetical protein
MTSLFGVKGLFECKNPDCKFRKSFEYYNEREVMKCPACKKPMEKVSKIKKETANV